ncbi:ArnT family glycosyltransferase [Mesorhizobium sp. NZP2298]|uniref:ArnT family glycosyltransferase n=1 Tax=Mesorhizobium sp. NZP2298 TaxID=2483403 RepID=UPI001556EC5D|nr:glycosyltransferase family 39 protein [Mesorhizobium sp. NZP2298]QKC94550.1 phospholipid carrier-dependent glycosyltransferase [Mesorhizobium sp. NZP2298]
MTVSQSIKQTGWVGLAQRGDSQVLAMLVLAAISASLAFYNIDFPYGIQPDESIKVEFAAGQHHNYAHPPLLIVLARFAGWLSGASNEHDYLLAGRSVSALACVAASILFYIVLRRYADDISAFLWACVFAVSPAIAVHAHYFKEDAVLIFALCVGLHALVRLKEQANSVNLVYFGFALGLAVSAKYVGAGNSLVLFIVAIVYCRLGLRQTIIIVATDALTILAIFGVSLLTEAGSGLSTVIKGLGSELMHAETGHDLKEWFWEGYGLTHFRHHLIPSLTGPTVAIALGAIAFAIIADRNKYVAAYAGGAFIWLFLLELSPLKLVGSMRYVLPVVVYLLLATGIACSRSIGSRSRPVAIGLGLAAMVASAHAGMAYVANLGRETDTRFAAMRFLEKQGVTRFVVDFPMGEPAPATRDYRDLSSADYLVSLKFQRHLRGGGLRAQDPLIYQLAGMFHCLDGHVAAQFSKPYGDYGYVAPTVRIYDLRNARSCIPASMVR